MILPLLSLVVASLVSAPSSPARATEEHAPSTWTTLLAFDEVKIDMDTARVVGNGPVTAWLRWQLLDRAVSPKAFDAGVRASVDFVEVDCARHATRTLTSAAYSAAGEAMPAMSYENLIATWRTPPDESMGGYIVQSVCAYVGQRSAQASGTH
jgi:hypothetical protein